MTANGIDIGVHGTEPDVTAEQDLKSHLKALEDGLSNPKKAFQQHLKKKCRHYAFSRGQSNDLVIAMLKKHGFRLGFTRIRGSNPLYINEFRIKRSLIYGHYDMDKFGRNLSTFRKANLK